MAEIIDKIRFVLQNYEVEFTKQESYRKSIFYERRKFSHDVAAAFEIPTPKEDAALIADIKECEYLLNSINRYGRNLEPKYVVNNEISSLQNSDGLPIKREQNVNKLLLSNGKKLDFITVEDAAFLYKERRIKCMVFRSERAEELDKLRSEMNIFTRDWMKL